MLIIRNENGKADGGIFNIGNPNNNYSIRELTETIIEEMKSFPEFAEKAKSVKLTVVQPENFYSHGYDDTKNRVPSIDNIMGLGWKPSVTLSEAVRLTLRGYYED